MKFYLKYMPIILLFLAAILIVAGIFLYTNSVFLRLFGAGLFVLFFATPSLLPVIKYKLSEQA